MTLPLNAGKDLKVEIIAPNNNVVSPYNNVKTSKTDVTTRGVVQERAKTMEIFFNIEWLILDLLAGR